MRESEASFNQSVVPELCLLRSCYSARACFYTQAKEQSHVEKKTGKNARLWKRRRRGICQRGQRAATRLPNMMSQSQAVTAKTACLNTLSSVLFIAPHRTATSDPCRRRARPHPLSSLSSRPNPYSPGMPTNQPTTA